jgi:putative ABC transport system permease protein
MTWIRRLFARGQIEADLAEEIRGHLEEKVDELVARGVAREQAIHQARREFGNVTLIEEQAHDVWRWRWIEDFASDVRFALRQLRKSPVFAAAGALTLAVGIGANTAVFSVVNAVMLRPLPFPEPERLISVWPRSITGPAGPYNVSYPNFFDFRTENSVFEHLVSYRSTPISLTGSAEPLQLRGEIVSWGLFPLLDMLPMLGRGFQPQDEDSGARTIVVSHTLWKTRLGGNPDIIGRSIDLDREPYTVIGVAPPGFNFPVGGEQVQIWTTLAIDARSATVQPATRQRGARMLSVMGRLRDGVSIEQAETQMDRIAASLAEHYPDDNQRYPGVFLQPALDDVTRVARGPLVFLLGAVGLVLLLACANLANLLLSRTAEREREFALRLAIGAARSRIARQVTTEALTLALIGGIAGVALAALLADAAIPLVGRTIPRIEQTSVDSRVIVFALALMLVTSVLFSLAPAMRLLRDHLNDPLKESAYGNVRGLGRLGGALVVSQVAFGLMLLSGAAFLMAGFVHLMQRDSGFQPERLLTFSIGMPSSDYPRVRQLDFYDQLLTRLDHLPGARSAALAMPLPLTGSSMTVGFDIAGRPTPPSARPRSDIAIVSPGFFQTAGIPLLEGRGFTDHDDSDSLPVLIVNRAFADTFFPGESAIGKQIRSGAISDDVHGPQMREIVGIVGNARQSPLASQAEPIYYFPYRQLPWCCPSVIVRAAGSPALLEPSVRSVVSSIDRQLPLFDIRTGNQIRSTGVTPVTFLTALMVSFAAIGLLLTSTGLYGVLSYGVVKRTREIGIRIALGASRPAVLSMVVGQAAILVGAGLIIGIGGSIAARRFIGGLLFGINVGTLPLLLSAVSVMLATGWLAAYLPARRAASIDPVLALRSE